MRLKSLFFRSLKSDKPISGEIEILWKSPLLDPVWYRQNYPDLRDTPIDAARHYLEHGAEEGRNPHPLFDTKFYLEQNPDVAAAGMNPLVHYILHGAKESRAPHPHFNTESNHSLPDNRLKDGQCETEARSPITEDLVTSNSHTAEDEISGCATKQIEQPANGFEADAYNVITRSHLFEKLWYINKNPDVAKAEVDPLAHYMLYGCNERRNPNRFFDHEWYVNTYPDAVYSQNLLMHYIKYGVSRGYSTCQSLLYFDIPGKHNREREATFTPLGDLLHAWDLIENSYLLERDWYVQHYKDLGSTNGDPLFHYLVFGVGEGRNPNRFFDTKWYLSQYPDVADAGRNPLAHYIEIGADLGYSPHPLFPHPLYERDACIIAGKRVTPLEYFLNVTVMKSPQLLPKFNDYDVYKLTEDNIINRERRSYLDHIAIMICRPRFVIFIEGSDPQKRAATQESLSSQIYSEFVAIDDKNLSALAPHKGPSYLIWLRAGDALYCNALYQLASEINANPDVGLIYFDHDVSDISNGLRPIHKPQWSPDYLEAHNYIGHAACLKLDGVADKFTEAACVYDFILKATESDLIIHHIDTVLLHADAKDRTGEGDEERRAIESRLRRMGRRGVVTANPAAPSHYFIDGELSEAPLVSIVIPTAGKIIDYRGSRVDLIGQCVSSICKRSLYRNFEFVVVDNGDFDRERLDVADDAPLSFVTYAHSEVNIARKINIGVANTRGKFVIILNDDIVAIAPNWIECMLQHFDKPHVGVVGARLLYPDNKLQHIGMVMCDGHLHHHVMSGRPASDKGYEYAAVTIRNYLSVTGAAMMVEKEFYDELGGYPEELPFDFNDTDFCLKARRAGRSVVYEPRAELYHYHAVSAERPPRPQDFEYFSKKWAEVSLDPYYNQRVFEKFQPNYQISYSERRV